MEDTRKSNSLKMFQEVCNNDIKISTKLNNKIRVGSQNVH